MRRLMTLEKMHVKSPSLDARSAVCVCPGCQAFAAFSATLATLFIQFASKSSGNMSSVLRFFVLVVLCGVAYAQSESNPSADTANSVAAAKSQERDPLLVLPPLPRGKVSL